MVGVHQPRVVDEAVAGEERRRVVRQLPVRAAIADRADAEHLVEGRQPAQESSLLLGRRRAVSALVEVAVVGDLVAGVADGAADRRPALGAVARDEERRSDAPSIEDAQEPGDAGSRAIRLVGHDVEPVGGLGMLEEDRALGVDVERDAGRGADAVRPAESGRQRRSPVGFEGHARSVRSPGQASNPASWYTWRMKVTIDIEPELYRAVKVEAARSDRSVRDIVDEALEAWLEAAETQEDRASAEAALAEYRRDGGEAAEWFFGSLAAETQATYGSDEE